MRLTPLKARKDPAYPQKTRPLTRALRQALGAFVATVSIGLAGCGAIEEEEVVSFGGEPAIPQLSFQCAPDPPEVTDINGYFEHTFGDWFTGSCCVDSTAWALPYLPTDQLIQMKLESIDESVEIRIHRPGADQVAAILGPEMDTVVLDTTGSPAGFWLLGADFTDDPETSVAVFGLAIECLDC